MGNGDNAQNYEQHRMMGLVTNIFTTEVLMKLKGNLGIGNIACFLIVAFAEHIMYIVAVCYFVPSVL